MIRYPLLSSPNSWMDKQIDRQTVYENGSPRAPLVKVPSFSSSFFPTSPPSNPSLPPSPPHLHPPQAPCQCHWLALHRFLLPLLRSGVGSVSGGDERLREREGWKGRRLSGGCYVQVDGGKC